MTEELPQQEQEPKIGRKYNQTPRDYLAEQEDLTDKRLRRVQVPDDTISNAQIRNRLDVIRKKVKVFELAQDAYNEKWMKADSPVPTEEEKAKKEEDKVNLDELRRQVFENN